MDAFEKMIDELFETAIKAAMRPCRHTYTENENQYIRTKLNNLTKRVADLEKAIEPIEGRDWQEIKINDEVEDDSARPVPELVKEKAPRVSNAINFGAEDVALRNVCVNKIRIDVGEGKYLNMDLDAAKMLYHTLSIGLRKQKKAEKDDRNDEE